MKLSRLLLALLFLALGGGCTPEPGSDGSGFSGDDDDAANDDDSGDDDAADDDDSTGPVSCQGDYIVDATDTAGDLALIAGCEVIQGQLRIEGTALTDLDALSSLTEVGAVGNPHALSIANNSALTNVDGLSSLTTVGGGLFLSYNQALNDLDGLSSLHVVVGYLNISGNNIMGGIDGLSNLTAVGGHLHITGNETLANLSGLSGLGSVTDWVSITDNPVLCQSEVEAFIAACTIGGDIDTTGNDNGC